MEPAKRMRSPSCGAGSQHLSSITLAECRPELIEPGFNISGASKFFQKPFQDCPLVGYRGSANLSQENNTIRLGRRGILQAFVAISA